MKNSKIKTEEKTFTVNKIGAILERMDRKIDAAAENTDKKIALAAENTDKKIALAAENTDNKFDKFKSEVGAMIEGVDASLKLLAESMDTKFGSVNERLDRLETKVDRLQDDMVEVKYELKQKVSVDQFEKLEKRVVKLEKLALSH